MSESVTVPLFFGSLILLIVGVIAFGSCVERTNFEACGKSCGGISLVEESANAACKCRVRP